jgi:hypothetical protein
VLFRDLHGVSQGVWGSTQGSTAPAEIYLGLARALREAGRSPEERVAALQEFPGPNPPVTLIFQLARDLGGCGALRRSPKGAGNTLDIA